MGTTLRVFVAAAVGAVLALAPYPASSDVAYIIKKPAGDRDVSVIFSYDPDVEKEILSSLKIDGHILLWQIQCAEKYVFYKPFQFAQGRLAMRPVLCLAKKYVCRTNTGDSGFVFQGYMYLDPDFSLDSPINITLADMVMKASFR